ncbi:hypothetical protein [Wielerella bovis]|uniref:hypothetical protein n=1 Tax=Wielerella bovis TaxID=2917790 RepID=UPI002019D5A6|nr:hypothetical protein [Wielerella bovis]ULJ67488.1 hypothetical protein MIS31_02725 [Wielerella bovis]
MTFNQALISTMITRQIDLFRYEKTVRADVFSILDNIQHDISGNFRLPDMEQTVTDGYALILNALDVLPVLDAELLWLSATIGGLATAYGLRNKIVPLAKKGIQALANQFTVGGLRLPETIAKQRNDLILKLKSLIRSAAIDDRQPEIDEIADVFKRAKQTAQTMTKTWINSVAHTAHEAFARVNPLIKGYRHISVLDSGTTALCTHRHGLLWDKKHNPIEHAQIFKRPPLHYNCRSKLVYVYDLKEEFDGMTGADWVKSRSLEELQQQFGKGVAQMLFDGSLKLSAALDGLRMMSLKELRKQHTLSVFSDNFRQRFDVLQENVARAKHENMKLDNARKLFALDKVWEISHIDKQAQVWLGASTNKVWLSEDTLVKQLFHHGELGVDVYQSIAYGLNHAEVVIQSDNQKLVLFKFNDEIYRMIVKTNADKDELFLISLFKNDEKEAERFIKNGIVLRDNRQ